MDAFFSAVNNNEVSRNPDVSLVSCPAGSNGRIKGEFIVLVDGIKFAFYMDMPHSIPPKEHNDFVKREVLEHIAHASQPNRYTSQSRRI